MNILIAGASGFIGNELVTHLSKDHKITVLGRSLEKLETTFSKDICKITWDSLKNHDAKQYHAIINLSGSNIGAKRWNQRVKNELIISRTGTNERLIEWLIRNHAKPHVYCANAIGIYGAHDFNTECYDENYPLPKSSNDFLQHIGLVWEQSLSNASRACIPVTTFRFGVVLKKGEGMLKKLELPFRLGLGSILGSGTQILSWIYYKDLINAIDFLLKHNEITGPVNLTSPFPITQKEFSELFAKTLRRPLVLKTPGFMIKIMFGEMGEYLLLKGQKVIPTRLLKLNFKFSYPQLSTVLTKEFNKKTL